MRMQTSVARPEIIRDVTATAHTLEYKTVVVRDHFIGQKTSFVMGKRQKERVRERVKERRGVKTFRQQQFGGVCISDTEIMIFYKHFTYKLFLTFI